MGASSYDLADSSLLVNNYFSDSLFIAGSLVTGFVVPYLMKVKMNQPAILGAVFGLGAASFGLIKVKQYKWKTVFFGLFGMTSGLVYKFAEKKT